MTTWHYRLVMAVVGSFCSAKFASVAWAHHPMPRPDPNGGSPWALLWLLGAGVFVVAFVVTFAVFSLLERRERRQRAGSHTRQSVRRS